MGDLIADGDTKDPHENRSRKRKFIGFLIAIFGVLLILGGTTFALWNDEDTSEGGNIVSGELSVRSVGETSWYDVSPDRSDIATIEEIDRSGHLIPDPTQFHIIPGDTIAILHEYSVRVSGDNLIGRLDVAIPNFAQNEQNGISVSYRMFAGDGWLQTDSIDLIDGNQTIAYVQGSSGTSGGVPDANVPIISLPEQEQSNFRLVIFAYFNSETTGTTAQNAVTDIGDVTLSITQVRTPGVGNFVTPTP
ncbi:SipW-dependent-type signal peptide-containing protein [Rhodococcus sp. BH5]|uniref:SipW-dependent-type signal peptide-containing protein n=1 Tax=Rhodococcus sp. BH5 TaxID=2871702 RepID=UPI0022CDA8DF|nr:SipW-dependent-type signal peptide-containing protein [Rhodococcus sp. BH5]MCZ9635233.1 SipW-dependent-type signal peptide-containing protein [Rhodococcus sp. BH5]